MARRMISDEITNSDAFLGLRLPAQALYIHMILAADDDGLLNNPLMIMRVIGATVYDEDDLIKGGFIHRFESGIMVINHWLIHNLIRIDRKKDTAFQKEYEQLELVNDVYKVKNETAQQGCNNQMTTNLQPNDNQFATKCPHKLSKVKLSKDKLSKDTWSNESTDISFQENDDFEEILIKTPPEELNEIEINFNEFWKDYPKKIKKKECIEWFVKNKVDQELLNKILLSVELHKQSKQWNSENGKFIPHPLNWLKREGWEDEVEIDKAKIISEKLSNEMKESGWFE